MHPDRRVVVTGIGAITPLGLDMASTWDALINGKSGVAPITRFDPNLLPVHVACEVKDFDPTRFIDSGEVRRMDLFEQYALAAARQAVQQANFTITPDIADDVGVVVGSSIGGFHTMLAQYDVLREQGPRRIYPFAIPMIMSNGASGMIAIAFGARGPSYSPASACATSNDSLGQASDDPLDLFLRDFPRTDSQGRFEDRRGRYRFATTGKPRQGLAAYMVDLEEDPGAMAVYGVGESSQARDLVVAVGRELPRCGL